MSAAFGLLAALVALAALVLAGGWRPRADDGPVLSLPVAFAGGAVAVHIGLALATLAGVSWSRPLLLALLVASALLLRALRPGSGGVPRLAGLGAWTGVGVAALIVALGSAGWLTQPDFYYHWGLKAARFLEVGGADFYFLAGPSAWRLHPDYPLLVPELWLLPALLFGGWHERGALALSALALALVLVALRRALLATGIAGRSLEAATAVGALLLGTFVVGYGLVGAADPLVALALLVALPILLDERGPTARHGWQLGLAAALAAAAKIEGVPLALLMIAADLVARALRTRRPPPLGHLARTTLPTLLVAVPWLGLARAYDLFLATNRGVWRWERAPTIASAALECALHPDWALAPLLLLALPWALGRRRTAPAAAVVLLQLALYFGIYFTGPVDTRFYVLSTLPRLFFHLLPAVFALLAARFLATSRSAWCTGADPPESTP